MADLRIPPQTLASLRPVPAGRADTVTAAQRAFFQAAVNGAFAQAAAAPVAAPAATKSAEAAAPQRLMRPGSLLDIKV